ncbi:DUF4350 domain-containing protein [Actinoplanes sp. CA-252034]|uniref:DUF4350 domain-containing protein n=1 Tax=Actinoplanes sp. CA-252034 TaxID=3239906 RepID=UPI003D982845
MRRRLRAVIPFAVLTALITGTLIVHAIEQPDDDDPDYLTPQQTDGISGGTLAQRLRARGITVDRVTSTAAAVEAIGGDRVTVFVATPDLADLPRLRTLPAGSDVVAVDPSAAALRRSGWPAEVAATHWTTTTTDPACADPIAVDAGPAAVRKSEYAVTRGSLCYGGAVATFPAGTHTVTLVGSPDPFRDDRISEHGNAALAVGLLARHDRVVWIDVHERDRPSPSPTATRTTTPPPPGYTDDPPARTPTPGGSGRPATEGQGEPGGGAPGGPGGGGPGGPGGGDDRQQSGGLPDDPLVRSLPPALLATLILLALILLALAAAAARRLGTPVAEPLPSKVPANETMLGHARLYQRARAREASLSILRAHARRRLTTHLGLPPDADSEQIATHAGLPVRYVRDILDGDAPGSNADLVESATLLQRLVRDVTTPPPVEGEQS